MQWGYNNKIRERWYEQSERGKGMRVAEGDGEEDGRKERNNTEGRVKKATGSHDSG